MLTNRWQSSGSKCILTVNCACWAIFVFSKLYSMAQKLALILIKSFVITKRTGLFLMVTVNVLGSVPVIATNIKCVLKGL